MLRKETSSFTLGHIRPDGCPHERFNEKCRAAHDPPQQGYGCSRLVALPRHILPIRHSEIAFGLRGAAAHDNGECSGLGEAMRQFMKPSAREQTCWGNQSGVSLGEPGRIAGSVLSRK